MTASQALAAYARTLREVPRLPPKRTGARCPRGHWLSNANVAICEGCLKAEGD